MSGTSAAILAQTAGAYLQTRWRAVRLNSRSSIESWRTRRLRWFLQNIAPNVEAFSGLRGAPLDEFPKMDKSALMSAFHRYNRFGITADEAWTTLANGETLQGCSVGASTGTSGNRGLYLVSQMERSRWLGVMLAKTKIDILTARQRVAVLLPTNSQLYETANESGRLKLVFFDLNEGLSSHKAALSEFDPTVIVATPHVLTLLADMDIPLSPQVIFSGAEVLDLADRAIIEARFQTRIREIYMATEGLFAVACPLGRLHLAEDIMAFEWEVQPDLPGLFSPVITDFSRTSQMMVRYQMNDLLRLSDQPCACGSALQPINEIVGRRDDIFYLPTPAGDVAITPDVIRNAVVGTDVQITDFRVTQTARNSVLLTLPEHNTNILPKAAGALDALFKRLGADAEITRQSAIISSPETRKLRRVIRCAEVSQ